MQLKSLRSYFFESLDTLYPKTEIESFFNFLAKAYLNFDRAEVVLQLNSTISSKDIKLFDESLLKLKAHKPIQYILGSTEFYGLPFRVNDSVLIPRPETEELVAWVVQDYKRSKHPFSILDIGTGSGCIAIALAHSLNQAHVSAIDVSLEALKVAKDNAVLNTVDLKFSLLDVLKISQLPQNFDVIVSNPPYVKESEKEAMAANVLNHEPHLALFVENHDALLFYKKIGELAFESLSENGSLYFEINQAYGEAVKLLLQEIGFTRVQVKQDIFKNDRMIRAQR